MQLFLYSTKSPNNTINKTLDNETEFNIKFKDEADIKNPTVILSGDADTLKGFNYGYIPNFNRYYFISNITISRNSIIEIKLECDVLESFRLDIMESYAIIKRQEKNINPYYSGFIEGAEVKKEIDKYMSTNKLELTNNYVLITIGSVMK